MTHPATALLHCFVLAACLAGVAAGLACSDPKHAATPATVAPVLSANIGTKSGTPPSVSIVGTAPGGATPAPVVINPVSLRAVPATQAKPAVLADVRAGEPGDAPGSERIVFQFAGDFPATTIVYVPVAQSCGSGAAVPVAGGAVLLVRFERAMAHDDTGKVTVPATSLTGPGTSIREARQVCDFEGVVSWAVGVANRVPFRYTVLDSPRRLVLDFQR